ncbi:MAG: molybdopterin-dependent oxidoreductase [Candidatus Hermodarchaeia archaeon]
MERKKIRTVCPRDCYDSCHLIAEFPRGAPFPILKGDPDHPLTQGVTCPRGTKDMNRVFSPQRLFFPYIRKKQDGPKKGTRSAWDEVLELIIKKLQATLRKNGPESVLHIEYAGNTGLLTWHYPQRLWNALGATKTDYSICSHSGHVALSLHHGLSYGTQPEHLPNQKLILFWGFNAAVSSAHIWSLAQQARKRNRAKIVVIDPRVSETAKGADIHLQLKPGSDVALTYGLANALVNHGLVDEGFIAKWTQGYNHYQKEAKKWTPQRVEATTGIQWAQIEQLANLYAKNRPNTIMIGFGMQKSLNGAEAVRAISLLPALIGKHRAFCYSNGQAFSIDFDYITGEGITTTPHKIVSQVKLGQHLQEGAFKFVFIYNMNPAQTLPNQRAVRQGLLRKDIFVVVHDTHWTETAHLADVVLPAQTYLEKEDLVIPSHHNYIQRSNRIIDPREESKTEIWVMQQLAQRLHRKEHWLFQPPWDAIRVALSNAIKAETVDDLLMGRRVQLQMKPLDEYTTPSGKLEFYSSTARKNGLPPLPQQLEFSREPGEFVFLNSALRNYTHTQFQDIYGAIPAEVFIHPDDAETIGILEGDHIQVENAYGSVVVKPRISSDVPPGILWSPRQYTGLRGNPQNCLVPDTVQQIGNGPVFNSTKVRIRKIEFSDN